MTIGEIIDKDVIVEINDGNIKYIESEEKE